jgi:hypothetical protein
MLSTTVTSAWVRVVPLWTRMPARRWPPAPGVVTSIHARCASRSSKSADAARLHATVPGRHASVAAITQPRRVNRRGAATATTPG